TGKATDAQLRFTFYIPENDAAGMPVLDLTTGAFASSTDKSQVRGTLIPIDPQDPTTTISGNATDTVTDKSIAVQKRVTDVHDVGLPGPSPNDTLQYTLDFQISDFFAFLNVLATDVFSDGQAFDTTFTPTITFAQHDSEVSRTFLPANFSFARDTGHP